MQSTVLVPPRPEWTTALAQAAPPRWLSLVPRPALYTSSGSPMLLPPGDPRCALVEAVIERPNHEGPEWTSTLLWQAPEGWRRGGVDVGYGYGADRRYVAFLTKLTTPGAIVTVLADGASFHPLGLSIPTSL